MSYNGQLELLSKKKYIQSFSSQSHQFNFYNDTFGAILLEYYGEEKLNKFFSFIDNYNIGDLHSGNFGFQNGRPVFIDYSGFRC